MAPPTSMSNGLPGETAGATDSAPVESSGVYVGERLNRPAPGQPTIEDEAPVGYSRTLRLWLAAKPADTGEESTPAPVVVVGPSAPPASAAPARRKTANEDGFSDAVLAWMRQGDRLSEASRAAAPTDPLVLDDAEPATGKRRRPASRPEVRARRVRQWVAIAAAAAGAWVAIAWASRPHVIQVGDRSAYAATAGASSASPAAASVRAVRLDAPGAYLAPQPADKAATATPAGAGNAAAKPSLLAVEVPTAAPTANAKSRRKTPIAKHHGRARH